MKKITKIQNYKNLILQILEKYELCESQFVLSGLELVGYDNAEFWLNMVEYITKIKGIEELPNYLFLMQKISREDLLKILDNIQNNNNFQTFEDTYFEFTSLLKTIKKNEKSR